MEQLFEIYTFNRTVLDGKRELESTNEFLSFQDEIEEALEAITLKYGVDAFALLFRIEGTLGRKGLLP